METTSIEGSHYFLIFIDDYSRKVFVYFLKEKSEVSDTFEEFKTFTERQTGYRIKTLKTDNGLEYMNLKDLERVGRI